MQLPGLWWKTTVIPRNTLTVQSLHLHRSCISNSSETLFAPRHPCKSIWQLCCCCCCCWFLLVTHTRRVPSRVYHHILLRAFVGQPMWKVVATSALLPPWRLLSRQCSYQLLVTVPFLSLHHGHGTAYHLPSILFHPSPPFGNNWRHICLGLVLANFFCPPHRYYDSVKCPCIIRVTASLKSVHNNNSNVMTVDKPQAVNPQKV